MMKSNQVIFRITNHFRVPGTTPTFMKWPDENQTWSFEKQAETQNYDVHHPTPRPKFGLLQKSERVNFLKISSIITILIFVSFILGMFIYYNSQKRRPFRVEIFDNQFKYRFMLNGRMQPIKISNENSNFSKSSFINSIYMNIST